MSQHFIANFHEIKTPLDNILTLNVGGKSVLQESKDNYEIKSFKFQGVNSFDELIKNDISNFLNVNYRFWILPKINKFLSTTINA